MLKERWAMTAWSLQNTGLMGSRSTLHRFEKLNKEKYQQFFGVGFKLKLEKLFYTSVLNILILNW